MESATVPRKAPLDLTTPLRPPSLHLAKLDVDILARVPRRWESERNADEPEEPEPSVDSPVGSTFGSSFSQRSSTGSNSTMPTEPSSPMTPKEEHDPEFLSRQTLTFPVPPHPQTEPLKRKYETPDEDVKRVKLPGLQYLSNPRRKDSMALHEDTKSVRLPSVQHLFDSSDQKWNVSDNATAGEPKKVNLPGVHHLFSSPAQRPLLHSRSRCRLPTPSASPEPATEYVYSRRPSAYSTQDPINQGPKTFQGHTPPYYASCQQDQTVFRSAQNIPQQHYDFSYLPRQQPSPPREMSRKERAKPKNGTHCNVKYALEETDFNRYHKIDLKQGWEAIRVIFNAKFPMVGDRNRTVQGIQGDHYRDNKCLPFIADGSNQLLFMPNGHVEHTEVKVREQGDRKKWYGLIYLYPERAMLYPWVLPEHRQIAADLLKDRLVQKERARREAMERGTWVEKMQPSRCGCCPKEDRERDANKREKYAVPTPRFRLPHNFKAANIDYDFSKSSKL